MLYIYMNYIHYFILKSEKERQKQKNYTPNKYRHLNNNNIKC